MKTLQTIQKIFHVFYVLAKIALIFNIIGASFCVVGALCSVAWYTGGQVFTLFGQPITLVDGIGELGQILPVLLTALVYLTTNLILLAFAVQYFKTEQAEGAPFTENGANRIKKLGIRCIYMPIVAVVITSVVTECFGVEQVSDIGNLPSVMTGIVLILASLIFLYGWELEEKNRLQRSDGE